jgi:hypothetical protein
MLTFCFQRLLHLFKFHTLKSVIFRSRWLIRNYHKLLFYANTKTKEHDVNNRGIKLLLWNSPNLVAIWRSTGWNFKSTGLIRQTKGETCIKWRVHTHELRNQHMIVSVMLQEWSEWVLSRFCCQLSEIRKRLFQFKVIFDDFKMLFHVFKTSHY